MGHIQTGRRLLAESVVRHEYWLMTDCYLPGEGEFVQRCSSFDKRAKRLRESTLEDIRMIDAVPHD